MDRDFEAELSHWKIRHNRKPLLVRGARQVGKTFAVTKWAKKNFEQVVAINFELEPKFIICFEDLHPQIIINMISGLIDQKIEAGITLLFLDEIQECPQAILALRYFKELMPELHLIATGSLLEFTLNSGDFRMPVGRIESLYLKPLSFKEYLTAIGRKTLREFIEQVELNKEIPKAFHQELIKLMRQYTVLGGMPEVIQEYVDTAVLYECQRIQSDILDTYRQDFGKYAKQTEHKYLQRVFEKNTQLDCTTL